MLRARTICEEFHAQGILEIVGVRGGEPVYAPICSRSSRSFISGRFALDRRSRDIAAGYFDRPGCPRVLTPRSWITDVANCTGTGAASQFVPLAVSGNAPRSVGAATHRPSRRGATPAGWDSGAGEKRRE